MAINLNEANFKSEVIDSQGVVLVDFHATWCQPCNMLSPILERLTDIKVGKVNIDENMALASEYQITALPTLVFFKNGEVGKKIVGLTTEQKIRETSKMLLG